MSEVKVSHVTSTRAVAISSVVRGAWVRSTRTRNTYICTKTGLVNVDGGATTPYDDIGDNPVFIRLNVFIQTRDDR